MKKLKLPLLLFFMLAGRAVWGQSSEIVRQYIDQYKNIAMVEMKRTGVPAAITLAQGIHETEAGTSQLVRQSNNHFGIKCKSDWTGATVYHDDDARGECFRKYDDPADSYRDHSDFLKNRPNYTALFSLDPADYQAWAWGLKKAGYATNPRYPQILIKLIEDYHLQDYSLIAMGRKPSTDATWANASINNSSVNTDRVPAVEAVVEKAMYPPGIFKINETNVVYILKGTSFLQVAEERNIPLSRIFEFNDMEPVDIAVDDQLVFLQRKRKTGGREFHTVTLGETLYSIAQTEGIRMENLLSFNMLNRNMQPAIGERLYLQKQSAVMPRLAANKGTATEKNFMLINNKGLASVTSQLRETQNTLARK